MARRNAHGKEMRLILSSDAKPRLKWTSDLHQRFVDAVDQLGGAEKATPKSLMRVMGIHGLTLYHLKSHLQKYRMGRSEQWRTQHQNNQESERQRIHFASKPHEEAKEQIDDLQMTQALEIQMDVQRKLHEQIEVQRNLQLRIEAQGKYLQSVLEKAQETVSEHGPCSIEAEHVKAQLSKLVSFVDTGCPSSSFCVLTQSGTSMSEDERNRLLRRHGCSLESSLTSCESSWRKDEARPNERECMMQENRSFIALSLMEMNATEKNDSESQATANYTEQSNSRTFSLNSIDLNSKSMKEFDSGPKMIDLNSNGEGNF